MGVSERFEGVVARALREALDAHAIPEVRDRILERALSLAGFTAIPERGDEVSELVAGGLEAAIVEALGGEAADSVLASLGPMLTRLNASDPSAALRGSPAAPLGMGPGHTGTSGVRKKRITPVNEEQRDLLVASFDRKLASALASELTNIRVHDMDDIFALLQAVEKYGGAGLLLLVDFRQPALRPGTIVSLARVLPPDARVVLWAVSDEVYEGLEAASSAVTWVRVSAEAELDEITWLCKTAPREESGTNAITTPYARPMGRVLLVDDDRAFREAVGRLLRACNYQVVHAANGDEAMAAALEQRPDVVLTDQNMLGTSGLELAEALRLTMRGNTPPIALVTAMDVDDLDTACVNRVVKKPVPGDRLVAIVEELLAEPAVRTA